jgi:hypothetical protein
VENDSIRASGSSTLVDIWIDGKLRAICVSREAIDGYLGFDRTGGMTDDDRCEFVRTHLPLVVSAAKSKLGETDPAADAVVIEGGQLPKADEGAGGDRRKTERRKAERRKTSRPKDALPHGERRRGDRRKSVRRRPPSKPT